MSTNTVVEQDKQLTIICCDRCNCALDVHEGYDECGMNICEACYVARSILPGQYRYALLLWQWWHQNHAKNIPLPKFWPNHETGRPLTPIEVITVALRDDLGRLPCGDICFCSHFSNEAEEDSISNRKCFFDHLEENSSQWIALLLYWWHIYYTSKESPGFWPTLDGKIPLSPEQLVCNATT